MSDNDDKDQKIIQLFGESTPKSGMNAGRDINIDNSTNTINNYVSKSVPRRKPAPATKDGDMTPAHRLRLKRLVDAIVENTAKTYPAVWRSLHNKFKVNSYLALTEEQYEDVKKWLDQWYASSKR